jgi:hypothetical protein
MDDRHREVLVRRGTPARSDMRGGRLGIAVALLFTIALACCPSTAAAVGVEAKVKSAYLYNFLRRTVWPDKTFETDESPYRIAILGEDNLEGLLEKIAEQKKVNKRPIVLQRLASIDQYKPCHMLYVAGSITPEQRQAILKKTAGTSCLVVADSPGFAKAGGIADFVDREDGTIGIELNLGRAKKSRLKFDQELVEVAQTVSEEE